MNLFIIVAFTVAISLLFWKVKKLKRKIKRLESTQAQMKRKIENNLITLPKVAPITHPDQEFLHKLMNIIVDNIGQNDLKADFISRELAMSHSVVYNKIKSLTGLSLIEFVRDIKLKRAAQMMTLGKMSTADVCIKIGFSDRKYFSLIFKNKYGMTPTSYIKSHQSIRDAHTIT